MQCSEAGIPVQTFLLIKQSYQLVHCNSILQAGLLKTASVKCSATSLQVFSHVFLIKHIDIFHSEFNNFAISPNLQYIIIIIICLPTYHLDHLKFSMLVKELLGEKKILRLLHKTGSQGAFPVCARNFLCHLQ